MYSEPPKGLWFNWQLAVEGVSKHKLFDAPARPNVSSPRLIYVQEIIPSALRSYLLLVLLHLVQEGKK